MRIIHYKHNIIKYAANGMSKVVHWRYSRTTKHHSVNLMLSLRCYTLIACMSLTVVLLRILLVIELLHNLNYIYIYICIQLFIIYTMYNRYNV